MLCCGSGTTARKVELKEIKLEPITLTFNGAVLSFNSEEGCFKQTENANPYHKKKTKLPAIEAEIQNIDLQVIKQKERIEVLKKNLMDVKAKTDSLMQILQCDMLEMEYLEDLKANIGDYREAIEEVKQQKSDMNYDNSNKNNNRNNDNNNNNNSIPSINDNDDNDNNNHHNNYNDNNRNLNRRSKFEDEVEEKNDVIVDEVDDLNDSKNNNNKENNKHNDDDEFNIEGKHNNNHYNKEEDMQHIKMNNNKQEENSSHTENKDNHEVETLEV